MVAMSQSVILNGATSGEVRISPDGRRIFNAGPDGVVRVYDTLTGQLIHEWQVGGTPGAMDISPDGGLIVIFDRRGQASPISTSCGSANSDPSIIRGGPMRR